MTSSFFHLGNLAVKFWTGISDPIAAKVKNLSEEDQKIYHLVVRMLREACERTGEAVKPLDHYLIFKRVGSWEKVEAQLRHIRTEVQAVRTQRKEVDPTPIELWATSRIKFINQLKEFDANARTAMEVNAKQVSSATQKELENIYLGAIKAHLIKGKAKFDKDAAKPELQKNAAKDYLQDASSCTNLIEQVKRTWDYLSVFSDSDWRHVTMQSNDVSFLIVSGNKGGPAPSKAIADGATKAIFTITELGVVEKADDHIQATGIALAERAFQTIEFDSEYYNVPKPAKRFYDYDPEGLRPVLQHYQKGKDYAGELKEKLEERITELSKFAARSNTLVQLAISAANISLSQRDCAYSDLKKEPATFLAWVWITPKDSPPRQPTTETITKIITVTKSNPPPVAPLAVVR